MNKASSYPTDKNFALLLIGPPKSGKTTLSLAFPGLAVLDCDRNLAGPMRHTGNRDFLYHDPNLVPPEKRWEESVNFLKEACASPDVETILVDGLSHLSEYLIQSILANTKMDTSNSTLVVAGEKVMQMAYWGPFRNKMYQFVAQGRSSGKRFIMTCHELIITADESTTPIAYRPLMPGQLRENIAGMFSDVWRTEIATMGNKSSFKVRFAPRNLMQIGNSLGIKDTDFDLTDKSSADVWKHISKYF